MSSRQPSAAARRSSMSNPTPFPLGRWAAVLVPGIALYFAPLPGLDVAQRHLLALFAATIISLVARPVPMGVSVIVTMTLLSLTGTLPLAKVLSGFGNVSCGY